MTYFWWISKELLWVHYLSLGYTIPTHTHIQTHANTQAHCFKKSLAKNQNIKIKTKSSIIKVK